MSTTTESTAPDPIIVECVRHKLDGIANECELTLVRSAFSTIVKEGLDCSASLFTAEGETLAQAIAHPAHLAGLFPMVRTLLDCFPPEQMKEGDLYLLNDPYDGGMHLNDIAVVMPVFYKKRCVAFSSALTHHQDVGGMVPGSTGTNATSVFAEGIRIPPMKLCDAGAYNETLLSILRRNVRIPDIFIGDLNAEIAACKIGARRLVELFEKYSAPLTLAIFDDLLRRSETLTRECLRKIPDGTYKYVDYLDNDGVDLDQPVRIEVAVTIKNDTMHCDFDGSSPQVRGPINSVPAGAYSGAWFAVRAIAETDTPTNGGCFRPLSFHLPLGSVVNPEAPSAVGCRAPTIKRIASAILGALRQAVPDRIPADSAGEQVILHFGGKRSDGTQYVTSQILVGGTGASRKRDGIDTLEADVSNCMSIPAEVLETEAPIRVHRYALRRGSGGDGRYRGGQGSVHEYEILDGEVTATYRGERHFHAAPGVDGGGGGARAKAILKRAGGEEYEIPSKEVLVMKKGDRLYIETAGGGGYGDPATRDSNLVAADICNHKITREVAENTYRAAIELS